MLESQPRVPLAHLPTPLQPLDRLSAALNGPRIWLKRDDCTGLGTGGNKTRKLEFLLGAAEAERADVIITVGAVQSNHARQTAAACAVRGLPCHLVLARKVPWPDPNYETLGNVQLDRLLGADVVLVEPDRTSTALATLESALRERGQAPYLIPVGGSNPIGALGYALCAEELAAQCVTAGIGLTDIVHATSSAGTQAGLLAGLALLQSHPDARVHGINVSETGKQAAALPDMIAELANDTLALAGSDNRIDPAQVIVESRFVGRGYGLPTEATVSALRLVAELEGVLLDPVYSAKAMGGLIEKIGRGEFSDSDDVIFIHTGGAASLPVYAGAFA